MLPVDVVTVGEDRAVVVRRGRLKLDAGTHRLEIEGIAPVVVDKTIQARVENGHAKTGKVAVTRVRRAVIPEGAKEERERLRAERDSLSNELAKTVLRRDRLLEERALVDKAARSTLSDIAVDAAHGSLSDGAAKDLAGFEQRERDLARALIETDRSIADSKEVIERLDARVRAISNPSSTATATLVLTVLVEEPGEIGLVVEYSVPNACWRPAHTASLQDDRVSIESDACIWQNSGEDWNDVRVRLSTERPSLGREVPTLSDDSLTVQRRAEVVQVEMREVEVEQAGLGTTARPRVPGIDDGGEVRVIEALSRSQIASNGRPHRVPIGKMDAAAKVELVCMPELETVAVVRSTQVNEARDPILAGPVELVWRGGFVGRSTLPFLSPGERFELGWGSDSGIRIRRETEQVDEDPSLWSGWLARRHLVKVHVGLIDDAPRKLAVTERIPVSEIEKVALVQKLEATTQSVAADADGFVRWELDLPARARQTLTLSYVVKRHKDVAGL